MESKLYQIRYTPLAYQDLDEIDSYISETLHNPQAAEKLLNEMETSINRLKTHPLIGFEVDDSLLASKGYRKLIIRNYMAFYLPNPEKREVIIMRILYGAREYRDIL